ncbi:tripartite tricarboxylate transporter substrate binding protein [Aquincola tertiaricarbonis]|uniref:Tripartite tricarboxylate transporter substrate binding protein n=1 Tax=Aquincola tertiaricarbonis TaxID=391953 RepID=A0ABY4S7H8_AQUTE|nr:tripartite tricarboxylate transporter substrate binding protein [Aquincola tertiaricarbonis]URI07265.1 tripartite tricarboxylate transporter substrate binding protein [Aquincola tertiaricarbonis]
MNARRHALKTLAAGSAWLAAPALRAQPGFPSRSLTLMVPWPAGAPSDAFARRLQPALQQALGQTVLVDNLGGAGGTLGVARAMAQPADGHTLLVGTPTELVLSPLTMPAVRYKAEDFTLLAHFGRVPYVLCSRTSHSARTLAEWLAPRPAGSVPPTIGNIGPGSLIHLMSLQFEKTAGLPLTHVPYRGVPPMAQDLMGGQLDLAFLPLAGQTVAQLEQGRIRALGVSTPRPAALYPQLPTLAAGDPRFEHFDFDVWGGVFVRRETPAPVMQRLHQVLAAVLSEPGFVEWSRSTGSNPLPVWPLAEAQAFYPREVARYTALLRAFPDAAKN